MNILTQDSRNYSEHPPQPNIMKDLRKASSASLDQMKQCIRVFHPEVCFPHHTLRYKQELFSVLKSFSFHHISYLAGKTTKQKLNTTHKPHSSIYPKAQIPVKTKLICLMNRHFKLRNETLFSEMVSDTSPVLFLIKTTLTLGIHHCYISTHTIYTSEAFYCKSQK